MHLSWSVYGAILDRQSPPIVFERTQTLRGYNACAEIPMPHRSMKFHVQNRTRLSLNRRLCRVRSYNPHQSTIILLLRASSKRTGSCGRPQCLHALGQHTERRWSEIWMKNGRDCPRGPIYKFDPGGQAPPSRGLAKQAHRSSRILFSLSDHMMA